MVADPSGRAVWGVGLRPFACWDCGFESRLGHGCLSLVKVVFCQVEVSATGWSLVQRSPTECGVSECDREASIMGRPWPTRGGGGLHIFYFVLFIYIYLFLFVIYLMTPSVTKAIQWRKAQTLVKWKRFEWKGLWPHLRYSRVIGMALMKKSARTCQDSPSLDLNLKLASKIASHAKATFRLQLVATTITCSIRPVHYCVPLSKSLCLRTPTHLIT
jgi:hypothetical protein